MSSPGTKECRSAEAGCDFGQCACGATSIEYGLIVALVAVTIIASVRLFGLEVSALFATIRDAFAGV